MNIIQQLQKDTNYLKHYKQTLSANIEVVDIDYSKGETDRVCILYLPSQTYSFTQAMSMLTLKQMMLNEEYNDIELYDADDIKLWADSLAKQYASSRYAETIPAAEFLQDDLVVRLTNKERNAVLFHNDVQITFEHFLEVNPFANELLSVSKSTYTRLEVEYYLQTKQHFVLFNWYTTA